MTSDPPQRRQSDTAAKSAPKLLVAAACVVVRDTIRGKLNGSADYVTNGEELIDALDHTSYRLIVMDERVRLDDADSWEDTILALTLYAPVVVVTRDPSQDLAIAALRAGAVDFIPLSEASRDDKLAQRLNALAKPFATLRPNPETEKEIERLREEIDRLKTSHQSLAERNATVERLSADLMQLNIDLSQVSRIDPLTRLLNRAAFEACIVNEHQMAVNSNRPYTVIMADVDHFKKFNDSLGHQAGDECLIRVADAIRHTVRQSDFVGRYGGEEIITLCPGMDAAAGITLAERIRESVQALGIAHPASGVCEHVTVSLGLAVGPGDAGWTQIVGHADRLLYTAKHHGRNRLIA